MCLVHLCVWYMCYVFDNSRRWFFFQAKHSQFHCWDCAFRSERRILRVVFLRLFRHKVVRFRSVIIPAPQAVGRLQGHWCQEFFGSLISKHCCLHSVFFSQMPISPTVGFSSIMFLLSKCFFRRLLSRTRFSWSFSLQDLLTPWFYFCQLAFWNGTKLIAYMFLQK